MTRVCITGASGFIGRALADHWRARGAEVVGVDRVEDPERGVTAGDVLIPDSWRRIAQGCDVVVHTAALVGMPSDESGFWDVNARGTRLALEVARDAGAGRFVHFSSVVTFGFDFPRRRRRALAGQAERRGVHRHEDRLGAGGAAGPRRRGGCGDGGASR